MPARFEGMAAIKQLWLFWVAPIGGAALAGLFFWRFMAED
jgi:aquaporin Z